MQWWSLLFSLVAPAGRRVYGVPRGPLTHSWTWTPARSLDRDGWKRKDGKYSVCITYNMPKTSRVLKLQVQSLLPGKSFFIPLTRDPPEWSPTACIDQRTNKFRRGGYLRLTVDLWPSLSVLVCSGASGRVRWCFRWGLWLMAVALVALKLHHFIQQFLYCH